MKLKWNGHASFTITDSQGTVIVTDPYDPGGYGGALQYGMVNDRADAVLVSHDHADHNYVKGLEGNPKVIRGSEEINGITVKAVPTYHDESRGKERGDNLVYVFTMDDIRVCFVGDLGHQLSGDQIQAIGPIDLLLIPVGGTFTVDASGAIAVVESLKPRLVIPMHFKTEKCGFPIAGVDEFLKKMPKSERTGASEIELTKDRLPPSGTEAWVLEHAN